MIAAILALVLAQAGLTDPARDGRAFPVQADSRANSKSADGASPLKNSSTQALRDIAQTFRAAKRYSQAIEIYERILSLDRKDVDAWFHLGELYAWTGNHDKAIVAFRDGLAVHPDSHDLKNGLAQVLRWTRRYDEAETVYREILVTEPDDRDALKGLADVSAHTGNFAEAESMIGRALQLYPRDAELHKEMGNILAWQKKYSKAVEALNRATGLSPGYSEAYITLGDVYFWMKSSDKAIDAYKKALTLDPDNLEIHLMLAKAYQRIEDKPLAIRHAKRALDINPVNTQSAELLRELEGRKWYSIAEAAGHAAEYLTFAVVFTFVYLNYRRSRRILHRRHRLYLVFAHYILPGIAALAFVIFLAETYFTQQAGLDPEVFHSIGEAVTVVILGMSFISLLVVERQPATNSHAVILAIGAHPDDIELGCGGYLLKAKESGAAVFGLTVSRGECGMEALGDRSAEQQKAAEFLGLDNLWNLGIPDTAIREHQRKVVEAIEQKIRESGATVILTHSPYDLHSDHQAVFDATKEAARNVPTVLCYEDVGTAKEFVPNYFVDITAYIDDKMRLVAYHRTQQLKPYMDPAAIRGRASHRGLQSGTPYAEAYSINRIVS
jgi:LmbE family N-acetylglucosaminyl deacetylase/tetratricopeptide (TPR) repeat protein